jgi:hypothetical protein
MIAVTATYAQSREAPFAIPAGSIEGNINDTFFTTFYSFDVVTDDVVTITMETTSGDLDPFLNLYSLDGDILQFNDDANDGETRNAQLMFTADAEETLMIEATRFDRELGKSSGTYRLTLDIEGASQVQEVADSLLLVPPFAVDFTIVEYESLDIIGILDEVDMPEQYFAFIGQQGDFVRVITTVIDGDLEPSVTVRNAESTVISTSQTTANETATFATIPEAGWYLIEVKRQTGTGQFRLFPERLAQSVITPNMPLSGTLTESVPTLSYVFNGHINDKVLASVELLDFDRNAPVKPTISIRDLNQNILGETTSNSNRASVLSDLPRSGAYIIQVGVSGTQAGGHITVDLQQSAFGLDKLTTARDARYNDSYRGIISEGIPLQFYRFVGKAGDIVTVEMQADDTMALDPFLILLDSNLDELAFNDTVGNSSNARIPQFVLPESGEYVIVASRAGLKNGVGEGRYTLSLTVGSIDLQIGNLTATLDWVGSADLNLFVREPSGRVVSWSNASTPNGGTLQIDSNTHCETPTSQPVEHIYYPNTIELPTGDYTVWVWYQTVCGNDNPVPFNLLVTAYNQEVLMLEHTPESPLMIAPNQRMEAVIRVSSDDAMIINSGDFSLPTEQITASTGGDTLARYDETIADSLSHTTYARFYQFMGEAGDHVTITVDAQTGDLDPIVILRTADDVNLATNDDASIDTRNAKLEYTLPSSGFYVIAVTRYGVRDGTTTGAYTLTVTRTDDETE